MVKQASDNKSGKRMFSVSVDGRILGKALATIPEDAVALMVERYYPKDAPTLRRATGKLYGSGHFTIGHGDAEKLLHVS